MQIFKILLAVAIFSFLPFLIHGAEAQTATGAPEAKIEHALTPHAAHLFEIPLPGGYSFAITNSMIVTWIVALVLIIFAQYATRNIKAVPEGAQNFWEWLVEGLYGFLEDIIGRDLVKRTFWFFATIFIFILFTNWFGLIPGVGTIGWGEQTQNGFEVTRPLLRGGNADLNMTFAMAAIFMVLWLIWALQSNGIWGFALHLFGPKGESTGFIKYMMIVVFFLVGFLELLSIAFRPISLSFRLYGNVFAGENLLEAMSRTVQHPAWAKALFSVLLPVPFYFLEVLVGLVQAFVFMLLTSVFTALICMHDEEQAKAHH
jgi:F-type H+-transporting ATPase subunit a